MRDPLFVSVAADGFAFADTRVVASCEMPAFAHPDAQHPPQPWGCQFRYRGGAKQGGCQYPQAVAVNAPGPFQAFWVVFSVNKEDIWIAKLPFAF